MFGREARNVQGLRGQRVIESVKVQGVASYLGPAQVLEGLSAFNFIFGANGCGKTTISRVIGDEDSYPTCLVKWKNGVRLETLVYSRDFVDRNFNECSELKGIFTLGEENIEVARQIADAKRELDALEDRTATLNRTLRGSDGRGGKMGELAAVEEELKGKCWAQKHKHDSTFAGAFEGLRNNQEKFKARVLRELDTNTAVLRPLSELEDAAASVFGMAPTLEDLLPTIDATALLQLESAPILSKRVVGKEDVDIAAMISKLGNSDWVREGRVFLDTNEKVCPFCQREVDESFAKSLSEYFDETFEKDSRAIEGLAVAYQDACDGASRLIDAAASSESRFLAVDRVKVERELFSAKVTTNLERIASKKREPSLSIELESLAGVVGAIRDLIGNANTQIASHNATVQNLAEERCRLTAEVWRYLLDIELKDELVGYRSKRRGLQRAIENLGGQLAETQAALDTKSAELRELEKSTTSVQPTVDGINCLLASFGFDSFSLKQTDEGDCYQLIRPDGSDAKDSLSEGEKTFVTFLYFYHLLKGSESQSGISANRVVVIDDPVSSLDSDILFIVSSLIKGLFEEVREGSGHIKQVFVLTHNVYFHKEVTFNPKRCDVAMREETFWVVRKAGSVSMLESHPGNPIRTSYELLWSEIRNPERSSLTIQNTMRRILENYFKILGGVDPDSICAKFTGKDRLICRSLFSWVNDGSHSAYDDLYVSIQGTAVDSYLSVFRQIFEKTEHDAHYRMMMGDA